MNAPTELATLAAESELSTSTAALILNSENMKNALAFAEIMASGTATVPKHLQRNRGDCMAVTLQAMQWGMNPFAVAQKTHLINGTLGYEAQLVISVVNNSGLLVGRLNWEWFGPWEKIVGKFKKITSTKKQDDDGKPKEYIVPAWETKDEEGLGVRCIGRLKGESEPRVLELLMTQARTRNSTLWTEDPKQQIAYLCGKRWSRLHMPDVLLGVYTPDELDESAPSKNMGDADVVPQSTAQEPSAGLLNAARAASHKGVTAYEAFWSKTGPTNRKLLAAHHNSLKKESISIDAARTVDNESNPASQVPADSHQPSEVDPFIAALNAAEQEVAK